MYEDPENTFSPWRTRCIILLFLIATIALTSYIAVEVILFSVYIYVYMHVFLFFSFCHFFLLHMFYLRPVCVH